ncbi:TauD/TfdA family dioxygenase [Nocardia arthritidis]|uniref:TauD/TfdA-like domain-containing protein n=1 Tax=Nocardia arthritidis TaxID=228602 RepID=A0A6G9YE55_9NOCA|nr:TauD/TfdA family dioxygenase [Nocardia arthritidis]QIS11468.1 hypothetical protein F5544_17970 [Nocardia arthritidis]
MIPGLTSGEVVALTEPETAHVWDSALRAAYKQADPAESAADLIADLPRRLIAALLRFRAVGTTHNALLLRGMCGDLAELPTTPATVTPGALPPTVGAAELLLLAVSLLLGEPFTFRGLYDGRLVQHVIPVPGHESAQSSAGSASMLQWHVEDGFTDDRCHYFGLLCLRGHPGAVTMLAPARNLDLAADVAAVLREPRFMIAADIAHDGPCHTAPVIGPVLTGPDTDPEICFDAIYQQPADPADRPAAAALTALSAALDRATIGHELRPGDVLVADNRRIVHGRTLFHPRYDGFDRWLLRAMTSASIEAQRRRGSVRLVG